MMSCGVERERASCRLTEIDHFVWVHWWPFFFGHLMFSLPTKWKTNGLTHRWEMIQIFTLRKVLVFFIFDTVLVFALRCSLSLSLSLGHVQDLQCIRFVNV